VRASASGSRRPRCHTDIGLFVPKPSFPGFSPCGAGSDTVRVVPTDEQVNRIVDLAGVALKAYRPDRRLYDALNPAFGQSEGGTLLFEIETNSQNLRYVTSVLDAVQLAFDAAAVAVLYATEVPDHAARERDSERLRELALEPTWSLEIEESGVGSFRVKLRGLVGTAEGRNRLLAVAGLAATILTPVIPGVAVTALIVIGGLVYANDAFGEALDAILDSHLRKTEPPEPTEPRARVKVMHENNVNRHLAHAELATELEELKRDGAVQVLASIDRESLAAAGVESIKIEVTINLQKAA
jgi:hypothetical protein